MKYYKLNLSSLLLH